MSPVKKNPENGERNYVDIRQFITNIYSASDGQSFPAMKGQPNRLLQLVKKGILLTTAILSIEQFPRQSLK